VAVLENKAIDGFKFTIDSDDSITYATAFNGKSIIRSLVIQSTSEKIFTNVTIEVSIHSLGHALSQTWKSTIGTLASNAIGFEDLSLDFYSELLFQQSETVPAELKIRIIEEDVNVLAETMWSMDFYSPDSWLWNESSREILSAYVQPNHPILRKVLDDAVAILQKKGELVALPGYQMPKHVRPMVEAIYQALTNQQITYSNPPASWDLPGGQRIRNAQTVLDEKVGTCLDTAVLFASLLEASGLYPVIALIPGHAFVGYWTASFYNEVGRYPQWTELPISEVMNHVDSGYIELFETTSICIGETQLPYEQAIKESHARISGVSGLGINASISTLINVAACRSMQPRSIRPLPASYTSPDGTIKVVEYQPLEFSVGLLREQMSAEGAHGAAAGTVQLNVPTVVKRWLDSLLDLSLRNPLINYKKRDNSIHFLSAPEILGVMEDLLQNRQTLTLSPSNSSQSTSITDNGLLDERGQVKADRNSSSALAELLSKKILLTNFQEEVHKNNLRKMASTAKTFMEETGANGLYLALGSLNWTPKNSKKEVVSVRSPLILLPVNLTSKNRGREFYLSIDEGSQVVPNFSLAEKLYRDEGVNLDKLVNLVEDESGVDIDGTFEYIRKTLAAAGLNDFRVDETAILGIFNFSTYRLWRDLLDNWKTFKENALVNHFIETPNQNFKDPSTEPIDGNLDQLVSNLPISSDASQARAISLAMAGRTFILQGPPGTGKSQTITNLLARALSEGKRVLFVAQKKDALDVVKKRLDDAGLGAFSLDLHDKAMTPKAVKEQLVNVIDIAIAADQVGFETAKGEYEGALTPLQKYRNRLHEVGRLGESIYSALDKKLAVQGTATMPVTGEFIAESNSESKDVLLSSSKALAEMGPQTGIASTNPWSLAARTTDFNESELAQVKSLSRSMRTSLEVIQSNPAAQAFLHKISSPNELTLTKVLTYEEAKTIATVDFTSPAFIDAHRNALQSVTNLKASIEKIGFDVTRLDSLDVNLWITKAQEADTSFVLLRGVKQGGVLKKLTGILGSAITSDKTQLVATLESLRALAARKKQAEVDLAQIPGIRFDVTQNLYMNESIDGILSMLSRAKDLTDFLSSRSIESSTLAGLLAEPSNASISSLVKLGEDSGALYSLLACDQSSVDMWKGTSNFGEKFAQSVPQWAVDTSEHSFAQLTRWVTLIAQAQPFTDSGLNEARTLILSGKINYIDAPNAFLNGYYEALGKTLVVERGFNTFEAMTINNHIKNLGDSHHEIRDRLPRITGAALLARRGFDSSMKVGAIGDLVAALKQPKNRTPIRTLLARNWGVVTKVTPCVLASPDSCVRFLDPDLPPFDLVVFDEASQIRVAHAIGAIGRAKAVVIVGDSKQMPPTSVAQVRTDDGEDDDEIEEGLLGFDMESILDHCETARVPDIMLNWHYRSEDESLIAFSNKKYYDGKLNSFPSPSSDKSFKGLSFQYVEGGQFFRPENRGEAGAGKEGTNPAEIDAILKYLAKRLKDPTTQNDSIGIVTFNKKQKEEIEKRLVESSDPDIQRALTEGVGGEDIFVKNLESVQGSERDVILFSVAFSKNLKGELPLNFGPLTISGGERRLNVAITRARKQVRIFCSFKPDELVNRNSSSTGVSHLAQFLKMANKEDEDLSGVYVTHESHPDRMRKQILNALRDAGLNAVEEVGLSDFKVDIAIYDPKDSTKALLGILLDGPRWNSRETVSDRDCLSVTLLRDRMGWPAIERIWLASWLRNPGDEVQRIKDAYNKVLTTPVAPKVKKEKKVNVEPIYTSINPEEAGERENLIDRLLLEVEEWSPMSPVLIGDKNHLDYLHDSRVKEAVQKIAVQLTAAEGPVSADRLAKFIGACFGFDRVVANRISAINSIAFPGQQRDEEGFLFPSGETYFTFKEWRRGNEFSLRHIQDISLSEISNAMRDICRVAQGVRPEQLNKEVSRLFGVVKVSAAINTRLDAALSFAIANGKLKHSAGYVQVNS